MTNRQKFSITSLPCEQVVVYRDRAEVKRVLKLRLNEAENEIVLTNCAGTMDQDTIRIEGHGKAIVLDVVCEHKYIESDKAEEHDEIKRLKKKIEQLENQKQRLDLKKQRINNQLENLHEFAATLSKTPNGEKCDDEDDRVEFNMKETINTFVNFVDLYGERNEAFDNELLQLNEDISQTDEELQIEKDNLNKIYSLNGTMSNEVIILVESPVTDNEVELHVSYIVHSASWTPKYDVRVFSDKSMIINYYGMIRQDTGEDWTDVKVILSTATPSIDGVVPSLETSNIKRKPRRALRNTAMKAKSKKSSSLVSCCRVPRAVGDMYDDSRPILAEELQILSIDEVDFGEAQVTDGITASTFEIPRRATIPPDNNTHKVSIGILNLKPDFEYEVVPKKSTHVFLKAKVKNTSVYSMLAGPANVFFDNNFIAKTQLKSYSPQEEFSCSLGVDPAIRVDYKPVRKFQEQSGILTKSRCTTYVQSIEIKNTTTNAVKLLLTDQLPLSSDEKIQVKLVEPQLKNSQTVKLNKSNNLEFDLNIQPSKQEDITIKYTIEHPPSEEIEFY